MKKVKAILLASILTIVMLLSIQVEAAHPNRFVDNAGLVDSYDVERLEEYLDTLSEELNFDIVIVTTYSIDGKTNEAYADDFYDYNGYGMGDNYDGTLLLVNMTDRRWHISTTGYGIQALTDSDLDYIGDCVADYLGMGEYTQAFQCFASMVKEEVLNERDGETLSLSEIIVRIPIGLLIGAALAFIPVSVMKGKMNNVHMKKEAHDYMRHDQFYLTEQRDMFLYRNVQRRLKPKDTSSTHRGSSGRSHGGRGGSF